MKTVTVQGRVTEHLRDEASATLEQMGMDMSSAIRIFLQQIANTRTFPFQPQAKIPNAVTRAAIQDIEDGNVTSASSMEEFFKQLDE